MGLLAIALASTAMGAYYLTRLGPRVAQRMATAHGPAAAAKAAAGGTSTAAGASHVQGYVQYEYGFLPTMTHDEALLVMGFGDRVGTLGGGRVTPIELRDRYRALMKEHHADVQGSPYLSAKINEARDVLSNK